MTRIGHAFPDYISAEKGKRKHHSFNESKGRERELFLLLCLVLIVGIIFVRLFYIQIIQGSYYRNLADNNRIKTVVEHAPRGIIFDRFGTPLVFNVPGFRKTVGDKTVVLSKEEALPLIASGEKDLETDSLREYPYKDELTHVLGYIGQISENELKDPRFEGYAGGDLIGKSGIERQYEERLKGIDEKQLVEVDNLGKTIRKLGHTDAIPGQNITTTIHLPVQKAASDAMKDIKKGAVIVTNTTGEVLAMVSKPSFDPNLFTLGKEYKVSSESGYLTLQSILLDSKNQPLLNRSISGLYPPGSTFKLVVAAAGLEGDFIDENYEVEDKGIIHIGEFSFSNWYYTGYGGTDGFVDVVKGIKRSNDIFFYKLAEVIGADNIAKWSKKFGLGRPTGIDMEGELSGTVPSKKWKEEQIGEPWYLGDTYHYGIGQGFLLTTPVQVNLWTQAVANNGIIYQPHFLKEQKDRVLEEKFLSKDTVSLIKQGMIQSCSAGGVAWPLFDFTVNNPDLKIDNKNVFEAPKSTTSAAFKDYRRISVACKTGTAEHGGEKTLPHAWITLFAPAEDPEIVVTVLAEESGEGSSVAAPVAKKVLEAYFSKTK